MPFPFMTLVFLGAAAGFLALVALGVAIWGLVRKNQSLWGGALAAFVMLGVLTGWAAATAARRAVAAANNAGKTVVKATESILTTLDHLTARNDSAVERLAHAGGTIVGKGLKAMTAGLDETTGNTTVFVDESVATAGIGLGRAEELSDTARYRFGLFLDFKKDFNGRLRLTAYDSRGQKMDNAETTVAAKSGTAGVHVFAFNYFRPGISGYCVLTKVK